MLSRRREKTLAIVVLLCAASAASAFPTVISGNVPACSISTSDDCTTNVTTCCLSHSVACDQISELGRAMLQPPSGSQITVTSGTTLPARVAVGHSNGSDGIYMYIFNSGPQDLAGCPGGAAVGGPDRYLGLARTDFTFEPKSPQRPTS